MKPVLSLRLKHYLHSTLEKSLIERVSQYFKDKIDYYPGYTILKGIPTFGYT
jgi:hypothetical protein